MAAPATGHLPGPVRAAARAVLDATDGGTPSTSTQAGQPPAPAKRPTGAGGGLGSTGAGPAPGPALAGLCQAFTAGNGDERGGKPDATPFEALARAAGGEDKVAAWCEDLLGDDQGPRKPKDTKPKKPKQPGPAETGNPHAAGAALLRSPLPTHHHH